MSSIINVLDEATRNKIAAGEVVERPASCVKELVENAIDAGATTVEIEIARGGADYIRVTDNGGGMSREDAHKCIIRHATSKISSVEDIFAITSLGFRGEAVPSIAAVSHMQITTRRKEDEFATHLVLDGGRIVSEDEAGSAVGTTMEVSDLFFNTPARRKFLKSERTESSKISEMITKIALAHPAISVTLIHNGRQTIHTGGSGDLKETIANIYGAKLAKELFPITYDQDGITLEGYIGKPSILKSSRAWQTCIVNARVVHNPLLFKAVDNSYHAMLPKTGYPFALIHIHIDPAEIDVNVHPAKTEIKFSDEQRMYRALYHSIITALMEQEKPENIAARPGLSRETHLGRRPQEDTLRPSAAIHETKLDIEEVHLPHTGPVPTYAQHNAAPVPERTLPPLMESSLPGLGTFGSTDTKESATSPAQHSQALIKGKSPYDGAPSLAPAPTKEEQERFTHALHDAGTGQEPAGDTPRITFDGDEDVFIPLGEVADCFIVAKKGQDLYLIDQHAAHERIRYDTFCHRVEHMPSQQLLTPEFIELDEEDMTLATEKQDIFVDLGYAYSVAGPTTLRVEEVPCDLQTSDIADSIRDICRFIHDENVVDKAALRHRSLAYVSCHGAIKAGDALNIREMKQLLEALFHTETPYVCPHGRPIIVRFTPHDLAKLFKRT